MAIVIYGCILSHQSISILFSQSVTEEEQGHPVSESTPPETQKSPATPPPLDMGQGDKAQTLAEPSEGPTEPVEQEDGLSSETKR